LIPIQDHTSVHETLFQAGAARVDITPPPGTLINGDFFPHTATFIHDRLYAKALVLQYDTVRVAFVVVDICVMPVEYTGQARRRIAAQTGIPFEHILISTTHTHAAGSVSVVHLTDPDPVYSLTLPGLICQAVEEAISNCRAAKIGFGSVQVPEHVLCRRYFMKPGFISINPVNGQADQVRTNPFGAAGYIEKSAGPVDPEVGFMAVQTLDGQWISVLANYSLHYVGDWDHGTISSDYFGEFSWQLQQQLQAGENFVAIMSNGTSGDVNCWDFLHPERYPAEPFQKSKLIAGEIAAKMRAALNNMQWEENPALAVHYTEITLGIRKPSAEEAVKATAIMQQTDYAGLEIDDEGLQKIYAREQALLYEYPDTMQYPLQIFRIGSGMIGGLSGELFAETGLWIKSNSPTSKYFTIGLANGNAGYIPPAHQMALGGYETWRCRYSNLQEDADQIIREEFIALLKKTQVLHYT
jgi:neutral ceramidase